MSETKLEYFLNMRIFSNFGSNSIAMKTVKLKVKKKGQKPITFKEGGLHASTNTPQGDKIPESKKEEALEGDYGKTAQKQAQFAKNVLTGKK